MMIFSAYPARIENGLFAQFPLVSRGVFPSHTTEIIFIFQAIAPETKLNQCHARRHSARPPCGLRICYIRSVGPLATKEKVYAR